MISAASARSTAPNRMYSIPGYAEAVKQQPRRPCVGEKGQIQPGPGGNEIGVSRAATGATAYGGLQGTAALLEFAVEIRVVGNAHFPRGGEVTFYQGVSGRMTGNSERPLRTVIAIGEGQIALRFHEIGQNVFVTPAVVTRIAPAIVIGGMAPDVDHVVDGARPAQYPPLGHENAASAKMGLRRSPVAPVVWAVLQLAVQRRGPDRCRVAFAPRFQQQDTATRVFGQPAGQNTAR